MGRKLKTSSEEEVQGIQQRPVRKHKAMRECDYSAMHPVFSDLFDIVC